MKHDEQMRPLNEPGARATGRGRARASCRRAGLAFLVIGSGAWAQSLFESPAAPQLQREAGEAARAGAAPALREVSLFAVEQPKPREFLAEDLVTIIISERSKLDRKQKGESKKEYDNEAALTKFIDIVNLLELIVKQTSNERLPAIDLTSETDFKGDAKYFREDRLTDRITAKILEVKPNGTLVLEARRQWKTDEEDQVVVLSGICRADDVTDQNTVQSNQLYDLKLVVENRGELNRATKKGLIPRVLETILNF